MILLSVTISLETETTSALHQQTAQQKIIDVLGGGERSVSSLTTLVTCQCLTRSFCLKRGATRPGDVSQLTPSNQQLLILLQQSGLLCCVSLFLLPGSRKPLTSLRWPTMVLKQCCVSRSHHFTKLSLELKSSRAHRRYTVLATLQLQHRRVISTFTLSTAHAK